MPVIKRTILSWARIRSRLDQLRRSPIRHSATIRCVSHRSGVLVFDATLLATSLAYFDTCGKVKDIPCFWRKPYSMTNKGLKISSSLYVDPQRQEESRLLIPLNCYLYSDAYGVPTGLSGTQLAMIVKSYRLDTEHMGCSRLGWCKMPEDAEEVENSRKIYIR